MKRSFLLSSMVLALLMSMTADARDIELGVLIGKPDALISLKGWQSRSQAFDAAAGWSFSTNYFHLHADYLWHNNHLFPVSSGEMPAYLGIGAAMESWSGGFSAGVRIPLGISYIFASAPIDIFFELAPTIVVAPGLGPDLSGGFGVRYMFGR